MRLLAAVLAAALLPLAAGCGSTERAGSASAGFVPADVAVYVSVDSDLDGGQWQRVEDLLARFPGGEGLLQRAFEELETELPGLDFEQDVELAFGPELAIVVPEIDAESAETPDVVVLTQPDDPAALERLLRESDEPIATADVEGWTALAETQEALDRFLAGLDGPRLGDSGRFQDAMGDLEEDALAQAFVDAEAVSNPEAWVGGLPAAAPTGAMGFSLRLEDDGARLEGALVYEDEADLGLYATEPFEAELPETVPGDAIAYVGFAQLDKAIGAFRDALAEVDPDVERELAQAEGVLGVSLEGDVGPLFADEGALYVRPGALIPEITLVTRVEDEAAAVDVLDRLAAGAGTFVPLAEPERSDVDGVEVRTIPIEPPFSLSYAAFDGLLVVTTSSQGIRDLRGDGDKLADADAYNDALDRAGVPDETTGVAWLDLQRVGSLLIGFAGIAGEDVSEAEAYLEPLESLVVHGTADGDTARFSLFLGID